MPKCKKSGLKTYKSAGTGTPPFVTNAKKKGACLSRARLRSMREEA
jgi:hypothetical protein